VPYAVEQSIQDRGATAALEKSEPFKALIIEELRRLSKVQPFNAFLTASKMADCWGRFS
jgi:hypothetical protein